MHFTRENPDPWSHPYTHDPKSKHVRPRTKYPNISLQKNTNLPDFFCTLPAFSTYPEENCISEVDGGRPTRGASFYFDLPNH